MSIMQSLIHYAINEEYAKVERLGDRLARIEPLIDWERFRPIVADIFDNRSRKGGRPNIDEVVMIKMLVLQQWYGYQILSLNGRRPTGSLPVLKQQPHRTRFTDRPLA